MPFRFVNDSVAISCEDVYDGFFKKFSVEVPTTSWRVRHSWKSPANGAYFEHMQRFGLVNIKTGAVHTCTAAFSLGSCGVLFKYGVCNDGHPIFCVKFIPHACVPPGGLAACEAVVANRMFASGRMQLMAHASCDLWSLAQSMKRTHSNGSINERLSNVRRFYKVSHFLASSLVELISNDVVMTDMKLENILVDRVGDNETYGLCDLESFSELDGSSTHPTRCTFEPCKNAAKFLVLTTAFATACTAIDFGNSLVDDALEVSFGWCQPDATKSAEFTLMHPVVVSATKLSNEYIEPWVTFLRSLGRHKIWGNQSLDKVFVLSVTRRLEERVRLHLDLAD